MALAQLQTYTEEDYYNMPEDVRAELIDGQFYYMAAPSRIHREILSFVFKKIAYYIDSKTEAAESIRPLLRLSCSKATTAR